MKRMICILSLSALLLSVGIGSNQAFAQVDVDQYYNQKAERLERRILIDGITAEVLPRASFDFDIQTFTNGGAQAALNVGLLDRLTIGLSYGSGKLLSEGKPNWNPHMEFLIKYKLLSKSLTYPTLSLGYCSQGSGSWDKVNKRYAQKSKGFFIVATKSYLVYRNVVSFTAGVNLSKEGWDKDKDPTPYMGIVTQVNSNVYFIGEYDFALNDNKRYAQYGEGRGFLNIGLEWVISDAVSIEFDLRDLLLNRTDAKYIDREVRLFYIENF